MKVVGHDSQIFMVKKTEKSRIIRMKILKITKTPHPITLDIKYACIYCDILSVA